MKTSPPAAEAILTQFERAAQRKRSLLPTLISLTDYITGTQSEPKRLFRPWASGSAQELPARLRMHLSSMTAGGGPWVMAARRANDRLVRRFWTVRKASEWGKACLADLLKLRREFDVTASNRQRHVGHDAAIAVAQELVGAPLLRNAFKLLNQLKPARIHVVASDDWLSPPVNHIVVQLFPDGFTVRRVQLGVEHWWEAKQATVVHGVLEDYFETGSEGTHWCIAEDAVPGYDGLHSIRQDDHLAIIDPCGTTVWAGTIDCDREIGYQAYPLNPQHGQPVALGLWIHWTQRGFSPDDWARFFVSRSPRYRAILRSSDSSKQ